MNVLEHLGIVYIKIKMNVLHLIDNRKSVKDIGFPKMLSVDGNTHMYNVMVVKLQGQVGLYLVGMKLLRASKELYQLQKITQK